MSPELILLSVAFSWRRRQVSRARAREWVVLGDAGDDGERARGNWEARGGEEWPEFAGDAHRRRGRSREELWQPCGREGTVSYPKILEIGTRKKLHLHDIHQHC